MLLKELNDLNAVLRIKILEGRIEDISVKTYSDAYSNIGTGREYGKRGIPNATTFINYRGDKAYQVVKWKCRSSGA